jgi:hypothetical protein
MGAASILDALRKLRRDKPFLEGMSKFPILSLHFGSEHVNQHDE